MKHKYHYAIAPLFKDAKNCSFAETWKPYLENENGV